MSQFRKKKSDEAVEKLFVHTFGGLSLYYNERPVTIIWESQKARILFCYLIITSEQWFHRDKLIQMLWPGADAHSGNNNFKTTLSRLRKSFAGPQTINPVIVQGDAVRINQDMITIDVNEFRFNAINGIKLQARGDLVTAKQYLEAAQDVYCGEFLSDEPFNPYISAARQEMAEMNSHVLKALARIYQHEGNQDALEAMAILRKNLVPELIY